MLKCLTRMLVPSTPRLKCDLNKNNENHRTGRDSLFNPSLVLRFCMFFSRIRTFQLKSHNAKQEDRVQGGEEIDGSQQRQKIGSSESQIEICKYTNSCDIFGCAKQ